MIEYFLNVNIMYIQYKKNSITETTFNERCISSNVGDCSGCFNIAVISSLFYLTATKFFLRLSLVRVYCYQCQGELSELFRK